jgi:hypothetical protein
MANVDEWPPNFGQGINLHQWKTIIKVLTEGDAISSITEIIK